ncbi:hypothetical protein [Nocardia sp. NPDC059228]
MYLNTFQHAHFGMSVHYRRAYDALPVDLPMPALAGSVSAVCGMSG